jgi:hypothetical protein
MRKANLPAPGTIVGEWTVLGAADREHYVDARCSCGVVKQVYYANLNNKKTLSCGGQRHNANVVVQVEPGVLGIVLRSKVHGDKIALIDAEDYELIAFVTWHPDEANEGDDRFYARGTVPGTGQMRMHRLLLGAPDGYEVDHINHDGLDNRRSNLRVVPKKRNAQNQRSARGSASRYKGVFWIVPTKNGQRNGRPHWEAMIRVDGKLHRLGSYDEEIEAAMVYDYAAREVWGEYAALNFPRAMALN